MTTEALVRDLRAALPNATILSDPAELDSFSYDASFATFLHPHAPDVVVQARTRDDVSGVLRFADRTGVPVTARGASGSGECGRCMARDGGWTGCRFPAHWICCALVFALAQQPAIGRTPTGDMRHRPNRCGGEQV